MLYLSCKQLIMQDDNKEKGNVLLSESLDILKKKDLPKYYTNNHLLTIGTVDLTIIGKFHSEPVAAISMSYSAAKALADVIYRSIENYQTKTGETVRTYEELTKMKGKS